MIQSGVENVWIMDKDIDLTYSPDDSGWYFQLYNQPDHKCRTSKLFKTKQEALKEYQDKTIAWEHN